MSLAEARGKARKQRQLRDEGIDPIEARKAAQAGARLANAHVMTFNACSTAYVQAHENGWRNSKHRAQWSSTVAAYAGPVFGSQPVQAVDVAMIMKVLEPLWHTRPETASRVRGRIEAVLDWATVRGYRRGENPARWRGHLDKLLPARSKVRSVRHHPALPYADIGVFFQKLRAQEGLAARAAEFAILTAARTGEVLGATWPEIDLPGRLWTVPAHRMKGGREHRVPLSPAAVALLERRNAPQR